MRLMALNFERIFAEKKQRKTDEELNLKVDSNIDISSIKKSDLDIFKEEDEIIELVFKYSINYVPDYALVEFEGRMIVSMEKEEAKELLNSWKSKEIPDTTRLAFLNLIVKKTAAKSMQLEEEIGIPFHLPLPQITKKPIN